MNWIVRGMKGILLVGGALTCTMLFAAIAPQAALEASFGATLAGPLAEIVVRSWGSLIALTGGMLLYAAFHVESRPLVLVVASASKAVFIALLLVYGRPFFPQTALPLVVDGILVVLFALYLAATSGDRARQSA
ncbi:hypothetical protein [Amaricoccus sp.]|jgi:hypothetical protein|uniref:hypothetical protein n=1 Tax=Amaricoccus sp. TaxID=1872485 RepID=UPI001B3DBD08|nr:hypothetical protein [Amaricoccus sp.]MBP7243529.1 hypothetical protein [Amaricoccus sp.]